MSSPAPSTRTPGDAQVTTSPTPDDVVHLVRVMTSVAEETRLIALNASLEAARSAHGGPAYTLTDGHVAELAHSHPLPSPVGGSGEAVRIAAELLAVTTGLAMYLPGPTL